MKCRLSVLFLLICLKSFPQAQTCPVNINFVTGDLTHWFAYTGNNRNGYTGPNALIQDYDSTIAGPKGYHRHQVDHRISLTIVPGYTGFDNKPY